MDAEYQKRTKARNLEIEAAPFFAIPGMASGRRARGRSSIPAGASAREVGRGESRARSPPRSGVPPLGRGD